MTPARLNPASSAINASEMARKTSGRCAFQFIARIVRYCPRTVDALPLADRCGRGGEKVLVRNDGFPRRLGLRAPDDDHHVLARIDVDMLTIDAECLKGAVVDAAGGGGK